MADAITHISTITPSGSASSMEFTSIAATYDDLLLIGTLKGNSTTWYAPTDSDNYFRFGYTFGGSSVYWNASNNYNYVQLYDRYSNSTFLGYAHNNASAGTSNRINAWPIPGSANDTNNPAGFSLYISGYRNTTNSVGIGWQLFQGAISNSTNAEQVVQLNAGTLPNNSAVNYALDRIYISCGNGNFTTSSKVSLYGISNS